MKWEQWMRTVKEEENWPNIYDTLLGTRSALEAYVNYYKVGDSTRALVTIRYNEAADGRLTAA